MNDMDFVKIAKALADPTRRHMIARLREIGEMTCTQVSETFPLSQPTISHHIKTLEAAGIITIRKDGQFHILTLDQSRLEQFSAQVAGAGAQSPPVKSPVKSPVMGPLMGPLKSPVMILPPPRTLLKADC